MKWQFVKIMEAVIKNTDIIYADNAATTRLSEEAFQAMFPYYVENFGNPSSTHLLGKKSKTAIENARDQIKHALKCSSYRVVFTSGGTEADNMALRCGYALGDAVGKRHVITTQIEHKAVLQTCKELEKRGACITYLPVNSDGFVNSCDLENAIRPDTALVSIMYANNEIGTIQPIMECAEVSKRHNVLFHTDAVQAVGHMKISLDSSCIDMLSFSAHKFHGPKGVGGLVYRVKELRPLLYGGGQEFGMRSGTENVSGIVGCGAALDEAVGMLDEATEHIDNLTTYLIDRLLTIPGAHINGSLTSRLPGNINVTFDGVEGEAMMLLLEDKGICVSSGSACNSNSLSGSHVLKAIGAPSLSSLRITLGRYNTQEDAEKLWSEINKAVVLLRRLSRY